MSVVMIPLLFVGQRYCGGLRFVVWLVFPEIELEPSNVMAFSNSTDLSTSRIVYGQSVPEPWMDFPFKCIRRSS